MLFRPVMRTFRASSVLAHAVLRGPGPGTRPAARQGHGAAISQRVCAFPEPGRGMPACGSAAQGRETGLRRGRKPAMYGHQGHVAEWLRSGLQIRLRGFDSLRGLHVDLTALFGSAAWAPAGPEIGPGDALGIHTRSRRCAGSNSARNSADRRARRRECNATTSLLVRVSRGRSPHAGATGRTVSIAVANEKGRPSKLRATLPDHRRCAERLLHKCTGTGSIYR